MTMELIFRGKNIYGTSKTKKEMIECLKDHIDWIKEIPDDAELHNNDDDYIFFFAEPKDKDDRKYLKRLGFIRKEIE
tara:strand:+ start:447 stop:677 length:231 start_codon:yes stop_codon:yes gene_type:complete